jgi:hypothetical protein
MDQERLIRLYQIIDGIPKTNVKLDYWVTEDHYVSTHGCGSIACAFGFAAQHPDFISQGLRFDYELCSPAYHSSFSYKAASDFFDISYAEAWHLFSPVSYGLERYERIVSSNLSEKEEFLLRLQLFLESFPERLKSNQIC